MARVGRVMYEYKATVTKVYDGDTITVDFDLGFGIVLKKQTIQNLYFDILLLDQTCDQGLKYYY